MDRGLKHLQEMDGLSCEDFFTYFNRMEAGGFKMNDSFLGSEAASGMHSPIVDASQSFLAHNSLHSGSLVSSQPCIHLFESEDSAESCYVNPNSTPSGTDNSGPCERPSERPSEPTHIVLTYINRMLMEEGIDEKISLLNLEKAALQATEKPFYDILGHKYPPASSDLPPFHQSCYFENSDENGNCAVLGYSIETPSAWQFNGESEFPEEFLSDEKKSSVDAIVGNLVPPLRNGQEERPFSVAAVENDVMGEQSFSVCGHQARLIPQIDDLDLHEGRSFKQAAVFPDGGDVRSKTVDDAFLCKIPVAPGENDSVPNGARKSSQNDLIKYSNNGQRGRGKCQLNNAVVILRTQLIDCAEAVAADDRLTANVLLKQIRRHSSPFGDGTQRVAHCFADGLEARMGGIGSQIYLSLVAKRPMVTDILKAYSLYFTVCPFEKTSYLFANQTIVNASVKAKASKVHIIDFGIYYGTQWPCLMQRLSLRPGGPPKLRITGIDVPLPGFRPAERIEETGIRLTVYAKMFDVPFEYNGIASKWESVQVEDLNLDRDEMLVVNCMFRLRYALDETVVISSPRDTVLRVIRKMSPDLFIHGVVNGSYSVPFFLSRFKEALFHFSALFDMLEATVPREDAQRMLIERGLFGREALNVMISCEGLERVERPETYKRWHLRNQRAGFKPLPIPAEFLTGIKNKVARLFHEDFIVDEDSRWLIQGWKGRILFAISLWRPHEMC